MMPMPWRDQAEMLAALRTLGVQEYVSDASGLVRVVFFPPAAAPPSIYSEDRPVPKPPKTLEERLMNPLGISDKTRSTAL